MPGTSLTQEWEKVVDLAMIGRGDITLYYSSLSRQFKVRAYSKTGSGVEEEDFAQASGYDPSCGAIGLGGANLELVGQTAARLFDRLGQ